MFKEFAFIFITIIIHEFGHLIASKKYNWNFSKIEIFPFGGCCKFDEKLNRPMKEELIILLAGPIFQIIFFTCFTILTKYGLVTYRNYLIYKNYHYTLLLFNLLPIYPLDGGRILNILISYIMPYKKSNKIIIFISSLIILILIFLYKNLNFTMVSVLLLIEIITYLKRQNYLYNRLLLERYLNEIPFKKYKIIKNKDSIYKDKKHIILYKGKYITEKEYLKERFKEK